MPKLRSELTAEELALIEWVESGRKEKLTEQQINLALAQARIWASSK
jgi:hypothetical protein